MHNDLNKYHVYLIIGKILELKLVDWVLASQLCSPSIS